jgi:hypothetical protein
MPDHEFDKITAILAYLRQTFLGAELSHGWADAHTYEFRMVHGGLVQKVLVARAFLDSRTPDGITAFFHVHLLGQRMLRAGGRPVLVREEGIIIQEAS